MPTTNTIPGGLQQDVIIRLSPVMRAFKRRIVPIAAFSYVLRKVQLQGSNKVVVPYYPLETATSKDFDYEDGYLFDDTTKNTREVTVNKRKYQSLSVTSADYARQPYLDTDQSLELKGEKLAEDVITDIFSIITAANYGAPVFTGGAAGFDSDDVADIRGACNKADWSSAGRSLVLNSDYDTNLQKDDAIKYAEHYGGSEVIRQGQVPLISGFEYFDTPHMPGNGENLVGFAALKYALLIAMAPVPPHPAVMKNMTSYVPIIDTDTGLTLEYRSFGDPQKDTFFETVECNYGYAKGDEQQLKRLASA